ncbi:hypothetical protein ACH4XT_39390 [Streptomyces avidinii]|uniref:hypothetical protein n=1 Tax=Streptomyces avidinii TaxID=1895 RepID=UPI00379D33EE
MTTGMTLGTTQPGPGAPAGSAVSRTSSSQRIFSGLLQEAFGSVIWAPGMATYRSYDVVNSTCVPGAGVEA